MSDDLVKILDGNTFVVSDERGDIEASLTDPTGLFSFDTRFLSKLGAHRERGAAQRLVHRRPAVLRDAFFLGARVPAPSTWTPTCRSSGGGWWPMDSTRSWSS